MSTSDICELELEIIGASIMGGHLMVDPICLECKQSVCGGIGDGCEQCAAVRNDYRPDERDALLDRMVDGAYEGLVCAYYTLEEARAAQIEWHDHADGSPSPPNVGVLSLDPSPPPWRAGAPSGAPAPAPAARQ